jgi:hypothetical protein
VKERWWIWVVYPVVVAALALAFGMGGRSLLLSGPHSVAAYDMPTNHRIEAKDLLSIDRAKLVGRFLRAPVRAGKPVTEADVAMHEVFVKHPNAIAAIIEVPQTVVDNLQLREGQPVQICGKAQPFGPAGKVLSLACDDTGHCSAIVELSKDAHQSIDPDALADATLAGTGGQHLCQTTP